MNTPLVQWILQVPLPTNIAYRHQSWTGIAEWTPVAANPFADGCPVYSQYRPQSAAARADFIISAFESYVHTHCPIAGRFSAQYVIGIELANLRKELLILIDSSR